jgi:hypothetical protein
MILGPSAYIPTYECRPRVSNLTTKGRSRHVLTHPPKGLVGTGPLKGIVGTGYFEERDAAVDSSCFRRSGAMEPSANSFDNRPSQQNIIGVGKI